MDERNKSLAVLIGRLKKAEGANRIESCVRVLEGIRDMGAHIDWFFMSGPGTVSGCRYRTKKSKMPTGIGIELNFEENVVYADCNYFVVKIWFQIFENDNNTLPDRFFDLLCRYSHSNTVVLVGVDMNWREDEISKLLFDLFWKVRLNTPL